MKMVRVILPSKYWPTSGLSRPNDPLPVEWTDPALARLANLWNESFARPLISGASNAIDKALSVDAHDKGRPLSGRSRQLVIYPLAVLFCVSEQDRLATVFKVKLDPSYG